MLACAYAYVKVFIMGIRGDISTNISKTRQPILDHFSPGFCEISITNNIADEVISAEELLAVMARAYQCFMIKLTEISGTEIRKI